MASATRVDGIVAFANAGENLQPAATAAVEARPQGNAEARPALAADRCACWAPALSIEPWMSPGRVARRGAVAVAVAGCVAGAFVGTRGGAGGVGGASTATGAGIAAGGRLADQGADGAICWRSIDGWLLGGPIIDCSVGSPHNSTSGRSVINAAARVINAATKSCVRAASVASGLRGEPATFWARPAPASRQESRPPSDASEARLVALLSNERSCGYDADLHSIERSCRTHPGCGQ